MARASTQHKLDRVRPPRVQVTYDVEIGDAIEMRELPFLVAVLGDFGGMPAQPLPRLRDRKFTEVNPDTFDAVMEAINPHLAYSVTNRLSDKPDAGDLRVDLNFKTYEDFEPVNVVKQVKPLRELYELRVKLADLLGSLQGNDGLSEILMDAITDEDKLNRLRSEIETKQPPAAIVEAASEPTTIAIPSIIDVHSTAVEQVESAGVGDAHAAPVAAGEMEAVVETAVATQTEPGLIESPTHAEGVAQAEAIQEAEPVAMESEPAPVPIEAAEISDPTSEDESKSGSSELDSSGNAEPDGERTR